MRASRTQILGESRALLLALIACLIGVLPVSAEAQNITRPPQGSLAKDVERLRSDLNQLADSQAETEGTLKDLRSKLDETGWRALDFASQLSSAQWAMFGSGLTILGLMVAVAALGAYQGVVRQMERKLDTAATGLEERLKIAIQKEEARLQEEVNKRMESTRQSVQARMYASISYAFWQQHNRTLGSTDAEADEKRRNLEAAIHLSKLGMECATKAGTDTPDGRDILTHLQSNTAYYLAELGRFASMQPKYKNLLLNSDRRTALELARVTQSTAREAIAAGKNPHAADWLETACWVFWNLGEEEDKRSALDALKELYESPKTDDSMKAWIRERYFENKKPAWN